MKKIFLMKKMRTFSSVWLCASFMVNVTMQGFFGGRSFLSVRSQSVHAERELVGWEEDINLCSCGTAYGSLSVMPIYSRSFYSRELAEYFFGASQFTVSGSRVPERSSSDVLADYFGLPLDFKSTISISPLVQNMILDMNLYVGLDEVRPGLYVRMHAPFVATRWNVRLSEKVHDQGVQPYPAGYMASSVVPRSAMADNVSQWFSGINRTIGDIQPLMFGKIAGEQMRIGLSEIQAALGWNFVNTEDYHFGLNIRTEIPTGNHSTSVFFFEPMVGNGSHWGLGVGVTGHTVLLDSCNGLHSWAVYGDLNLTHLFGSLNRRSFDFKKNGPGSRYILIEEIGTPVVQGLLVDMHPALQQYHGKIMPAINKTTLDAYISIAVQADAVFKMCYTYKCVTADVGYNLWARTAERIECRQMFPENCFAIKGDAQVYGFNADTPERFVALNVTQSLATMRAGQGSGNANNDFTNANGDNTEDNVGNPVFATFEFAPGSDELTQMFPPIAAVRGSDQAILLSDRDIDTFSAASPAALSNTFFGHVRYTGNCLSTLVPFIGVGGEVTLDGNVGRRNNALSEWAIWIKGGVSY